LEEWRTISGLDRKTDDALWKRYSTARETFNRRRGSHFAELDRERAGARQAKEALCERAEELSGSTDWGATSAAFRDLLTEWKAAGDREEGARHANRRRRPRSEGKGRPIPGPRRTIRAAGGKGRSGRADQGRRGSPGQRRTVASVGRCGRQGDPGPLARLSGERGCQRLSVWQDALLDELAPHHSGELHTAINQLAVAGCGVAGGHAGRPWAALDDHVLDLEPQTWEAAEELVAQPRAHCIGAVQLRRQGVVAEVDEVDVVGDGD